MWWWIKFSFFVLYPIFVNPSAEEISEKVRHLPWLHLLELDKMINWWSHFRYWYQYHNIVSDSANIIKRSQLSGTIYQQIQQLDFIVLQFESQQGENCFVAWLRDATFWCHLLWNRNTILIFQIYDVMELILKVHMRVFAKLTSTQCNCKENEFLHKNLWVIQDGENFIANKKLACTAEIVIACKSQPRFYSERSKIWVRGWPGGMERQDQRWRQDFWDSHAFNRLIPKLN